MPGRVEHQSSDLARYGHRGGVAWLTGLPGSGKTTLANALERVLVDRGMHVVVLDGDEIRRGLSADLGFSATDRAENIRRVAEVAKLLADAGLIVIAAFVSPCHSDRTRARRIVEDTPSGVSFTEIYLDVPLSVCEARDPKRMYAQARTGAIETFTGVSAPYEPPTTPDLIVRTHACTVEEGVAAILDHLIPRLSMTE